MQCKGRTEPDPSFRLTHNFDFPGETMLEYLDKQTKLTGNQYRIIAAAVLGDMLEFFDFFLIGFVLAITI